MKVIKYNKGGKKRMNYRDRLLSAIENFHNTKDILRIEDQGVYHLWNEFLQRFPEASFVK